MITGSPMWLSYLEPYGSNAEKKARYKVGLKIIILPCTKNVYALENKWSIFLSESWYQYYLITGSPMWVSYLEPCGSKVRENQDIKLA